MSRPKKDNVPISLRIDSNLNEQLKEFCEESGQSKTVAIERAVESYINDYNKKRELLKSLNGVE